MVTIGIGKIDFRTTYRGDIMVQFLKLKRLIQSKKTHKLGVDNTSKFDTIISPFGIGFSTD